MAPGRRSCLLGRLDPEGRRGAFSRPPPVKHAATGNIYVLGYFRLTPGYVFFFRRCGEVDPGKIEEAQRMARISISLEPS